MSLRGGLSLISFFFFCHKNIVNIPALYPSPGGSKSWRPSPLQVMTSVMGMFLSRATLEMRTTQIEPKPHTCGGLLKHTPHYPNGAQEVELRFSSPPLPRCSSFMPSSFLFFILICSDSEWWQQWWPRPRPRPRLWHKNNHNKNNQNRNNHNKNNKN